MKKVLLVIICLLLVGCGSKESEEIKPGKINCEQMEEIMKGDNNPQLIDVRSEDEYKEGHLYNSMNIPYDSVVSGIEGNEIITKDTPIIVYCKSGARSSKAYESLVNAGYKKVYDLGAMSNCK